MKQLLIYLHVPKTGGTTLKTIIQHNIEPAQVYNVYERSPAREEMLRNIASSHPSCIQGHFSFGVHQYFQAPFTYITMLRHPVDRILSTYYKIKANSSHDMHKQIAQLSLEEFIHMPGNINKQTHIMSGKRGMKITDHDVELAMDHINKYFAVVGITEMFDESIFLMKQKLHWNHISYEKRNVTQNRPEKQEHSQQLIRTIKTLNQHDMELYRYAKRRLKSELQFLTTAQKQELQAFMLRNRH